MSLSHDRSTHYDEAGEDASKVTLPSLSALLRPIRINLNVYIFPKVIHHRRLDSTLDLAQDADPANHIATASSSAHKVVEVRVIFGGPKVLWPYDVRSVTRLPPLIEKRIRLSAMAHMRILNKKMQATSPSLASMYGMDIDLRYVDFWVDTNRPVSTQEFSKLILALLPPITEGEPTTSQRCVAWAIVCRRCGEVVYRHKEDQHWNERYLFHRVGPQCWPPAVQATSGENSPRGAQGATL